MKVIGATKAKRQKIKSHIPIFINKSELRTQERHLEEEKWGKIMYHDLHRQYLLRSLEYIDSSKGKDGKKRNKFRAESMESMKNVVLFFPFLPFNGSKYSNFLIKA